MTIINFYFITDQSLNNLSMDIPITENEIKKEIPESPDTPDRSINNVPNLYKRPVRSNVRNARSFLFSSPRFKPARAKSSIIRSQPIQESIPEPISNEEHPPTSPKPSDTTSQVSLPTISTDFNFPLTTIDELGRLNDVLAVNKEFRRDFIKRFAATRYKITKRSKFNYAYAVVDAIFEKDLLAIFTWAHKGKQRKLPFNDYEHIISAFSECLASHDKRYTKENTKFFLHQVLFRNIKWRSVARKFRRAKSLTGKKVGLMMAFIKFKLCFIGPKSHYSLHHFFSIFTIRFM